MSAHALERIKNSIAQMRERLCEKKVACTSPVILMDATTERWLYDICLADVGETVYSAMMYDGPREAFLVIYGIPVIYDEPEFQVLDLDEIEDDLERKKMSNLRDMTLAHLAEHFSVEE